MGLFVEPSVYCKLILPHISSVSTSAGKALSSALAILAALIRGANHRLLDPLLKVKIYHYYDIRIILMNKNLSDKI